MIQLYTQKTQNHLIFLKLLGSIRYYVRWPNYKMKAQNSIAFRYSTFELKTLHLPSWCTAPLTVLCSPAWTPFSSGFLPAAFSHWEALEEVGAWEEGEPGYLPFCRLAQQWLPPLPTVLSCSCSFLSTFCLPLPLSPQPLLPALLLPPTCCSALGDFPYSCPYLVNTSYLNPS